jgi:putative ABC transport system substrate-binding protein
MAIHIRRREFIFALGGATTWPLVARAQQPTMPVIGFLHSGSPEPVAHQLAAFRRGLAERGYVEGKDLIVEYRWAQGQYHRLPGLASDLALHQVSVIVAGTSPGSIAAKSATSTIPIVFTGVGGDPIKLGLVDTFNRPSGNITGVYILSTALEPKKLELLREILPVARTVGYLFNPKGPNAETQVSLIRNAAESLRLQVRLLAVW